MMLTPWVRWIIFANVAVFVAQRFIPDFDAFSRLLVLWPPAIPYRPWTLVTYMFLHQGFSHIFFNMLSLLIFGPRLEVQLSGRGFLGLYLVSGIAGGLLSWVFPPDAPIIGASAAVFGVMLGYARFWPRDQIFLWFVPMPVWVAVLVMTGLDLFGGFSGRMDNIAHFAHVGGFVGAAVYLRLWDMKPRRQRKFEAQQKGPRVSRSDLDRWTRIPRDRLHEVNREELDRILEKIARDGVGSVTPQERNFLDNFSDRTQS